MSLTGVIGVDDQSVLGLAQDDGHLQCRADQFGWHVRRHHPTHDLARIQIQHGRQVQPAAISANVGDVGRPGLIRGIGIEAPVQEVGGHRQVMSAVGGVGELAFPARLPLLLHQPAHSVAADLQALGLQRRTQPAAAIKADALTLSID